MKLPRTTLILVLLALGLGGFVYFFEIQGTKQREAAQAQEKQIFSFAAEDIQTLNIKTNDSKVSLERNSDRSQKNKWLLKSPSQEAASNASVSYLTDLLVNEKSNTKISISKEKLSQYGLDKPQGTIEIKLKNKEVRKLILGSSDFQDQSLYARKKLNSNSSDKIEVLLVSKNFANAVNRELSEWKQEENTPGQPLPPLDLKPTPESKK
ncbi:MAG: DUF4340 domain-containing protein [Mastigocoleus sp. MO_167.B18]|nr:DUF4340 domain-containing protein [Mastigocoleus sp. MO_167.B18]